MAAEGYIPTRDSPVGAEPETLYIWMLGGFRVRVASRFTADEEWRLKKARSVIKILALARTHQLQREKIMDLLWPDLSPKAASNNLNYTLHVTRRLLEPERISGSRFLCLRGEQVALYPQGPLWTDVQAFEEAAAKARRSRQLTAYRTAVERYTGELLPEDSYEDWAEEPRAELQEAQQGLLAGLATIYEARGESEAALETLQEIARSTPADERAQLRLMRLYAAAGNRHHAMRQYERLETALHSMGAEPDAGSRHLYEQIQSGRISLVSGLARDRLPPESARHNLPVNLSSFVGRRREIERLRGLLEGARLMTLAGPGGSGKTRLALQLCGEIVERYPDGVWVVELATLPHSALLPQAVARALAVEEQQDRTLTETLVDELRYSGMLVVLDNCEHLVDGCARFVEALLRACPGVRILTTSREVLRLPEETVWRVPPLSLPDPRHSEPARAAARYEAVSLFLQRAKARFPGFLPTSDDVVTVTEICRRLDGMPLAIELAAAKVGALSVQQIHARLDDRFRLLAAGSRTAPERQQTLRGTLDWSHALLTSPERKLFNRLSVFARGFSLEAAEFVCTGAGIAAADVPELLSRLVDKSRVVAEVTTCNRVRYGMLQTIRRYGLDRLEESGDGERVRQRHAQYYLEMAEPAEPMAMQRRDHGQAPMQPSHRLSQRELDIAELVVQGLTNRQISASLFISQRTADTHVSNILHKLGLSSREQVADWWEEPP